MLIIAVEINVSKHITKIDLNSANDKFTIFTDGEQVDESEAVIVTIPVPQILGQLKGSIAQFIGNHKLLLKTIHQTIVFFF
jgi:protoporphyrinogen oxidase